MQKLLSSDENKIGRFSQYDALSKHTEYYAFFILYISMPSSY